MRARLRLVHLHLQGRGDRGDADLAIEPGEQIAGRIGGGGSGLNNAGLGHLLLMTQENTHHRAVNMR
jgi:hypothetical protein